MNGVLSFLSFAIRHWVLSILVVLSVLSQGLGYWQQGTEIWEAGPPAWVLQIVGYLLFVGVVSYLLFDWDKKIQQLPVGPIRPKLSAAEESEQRRRAERDVERSTALLEIENAIDNADWEDYTPSASSIESSMAVLESAFATLRKVYSLDTPKLTVQNKNSLMLGVRYLRRVQPFLRAGHVEEAQQAASEFLS